MRLRSVSVNEIVPSKDTSGWPKVKGSSIAHESGRGNCSRTGIFSRIFFPVAAGQLPLTLDFSSDFNPDADRLCSARNWL